jgi:hypothetical protein
MTATTGFTVKEAKNIEFHNVQVNTQSGPSIAAERVSNLTVENVKTYTPHPATPVVELTDVADAFLYNASPRPGTEVFLKLSGEKTKDITLEGNNFRHVKTPVLQDKSVPGKPVTETVKVSAIK